VADDTGKVSGRRDIYIYIYIYIDRSIDR
jgi:hypothetical protein